MTFEAEILLFAALRERLKSERIRIVLPSDATAADVKIAVAKTHPELAALVEPCRVAVDQAFASAGDPVRAGSEIALIPPVSGGHDGADGSPDDAQTVYVGPAPLRHDAVVAAVAHVGAGGLVTFSGQVRQWSRGEEICHLEYEAYVPMAHKVICQLITAIEKDIPGSRVAVHHRLGRLELGDTAVIIAASAPHRAEAFAACRDAIEALKRDVPIWKREHATSGTVWIGQGP